MSARVTSALLWIIGAVVWSASTAAAGPLMGRTRLEIGGGWRHHPANIKDAVLVDDRLVASATEGAIGRIGFGYWTSDDVAFTLGYTIHDVETYSLIDEYDFAYEETTIVHSLMFGLRFYMPQSRPYSAVRPYFSAEAGPFIGTAERNDNEDCGCDDYYESHSKAVPAARLGGGVDFMVGRQLMVGFNGGYNFVEEFVEPVGGRYDYSGSEFGVTFSILFGRGRR